jgi:hypothetical protein
MLAWSRRFRTHRVGPPGSTHRHAIISAGQHASLVCTSSRRSDAAPSLVPGPFPHQRRDFSWVAAATSTPTTSPRNVSPDALQPLRVAARDTCSIVWRAETGSPFMAQQVIIPSTAVRRRLELACADRQGICANVEFSYLAQWLWTQIGRSGRNPGACRPSRPRCWPGGCSRLLGDAGFTSGAYARLARYLARRRSGHAPRSRRALCAADRALHHLPPAMAGRVGGGPERRHCRSWTILPAPAKTSAGRQRSLAAADWSNWASTASTRRSPSSRRSRASAATPVGGPACPRASASSACRPCRRCTWTFCVSCRAGSTSSLYAREPVPPNTGSRLSTASA